jgi:hypothetical protein
MHATNPVFRLPAKIALVFQGLTIMGGVAFVLGLFVSPQCTWANVLLLGYYLAGLGLGGLLIMALHYVTGARWSTPLLRVSEAWVAVLPAAALGILTVLLFRPSLYSWTQATDQVPDSPLAHLWLSRSFFLLRATLYLTVWLAFAVVMVRSSRRQDDVGDNAPPSGNRLLSAGFLVAFGLTCWLAGSDWILSLEPRWFSTIFAVYQFAGILLTSLAAVTLLALWLRRQGSLAGVLGEDHFHDLATLLFGFSCFWMYIWFCQYLLIWFTNQPEEAVYYVKRWQGGWPALMLLNIILNWGIPFCLLLFRAAKRSPRILGTVCVLVLLGRWFDLFVQIFPAQDATTKLPGPLEAGLFIGAAALTALIVFRASGRTPLMQSGGTTR